MRSGERLWTITAGLCLLVLASACSPGSVTRQSSGGARVSPSPTTRTSPIPIDQAPADLAAKWRDLDVTVIPPAGYGLEVQLTQEVVNHTGGRVDDATARKWAADYLRADGWSKWGTENLQLDGFFRHLAPPDAISQAGIFGDEFSAMQKAQKAGASLDVKFLTVTRLTLVTVSPTVKQALTSTYGYPAPLPDYAFVVDSHGPGYARLHYADGHVDSFLELPATNVDQEFAAGTEIDQPDTVGAIWVLHTYLSCAKSDFLRTNCSA